MTRPNPGMMETAIPTSNPMKSTSMLKGWKT